MQLIAFHLLLLVGLFLEESSESILRVFTLNPRFLRFEGLCKVQVDNVHIVALLKQIQYVAVVG